MKAALERTPLYKRAMQTMNIKWLGLKISPTLLVGLREGKDKNEEDKEWEEPKNNAWFYPPEGIPSMLPWDVK